MYSEGEDLAGFFINSLHGTLVFRIISKSVHTCVCVRLCLLSVQYVWYKIAYFELAMMFLALLFCFVYPGLVLYSTVRMDRSLMSEL